MCETYINHRYCLQLEILEFQDANKKHILVWVHRDFPVPKLLLLKKRNRVQLAPEIIQSQAAWNVIRLVAFFDASLPILNSWLC